MGADHRGDPGRAVTAVVRLRPLGEPWQTLGTGRHRGVWPEQLVAISDTWGPREASFALARRRGAIFPDLLARTRVEIDVAGALVWSGRIKDTPEQTGSAISVQCEGKQYILDDDAFEKTWVHTALGDYKDIRTVATDVHLPNWGTSGQVSTDGGILIGWPKGVTIRAGNGVGVTLDLGPDTASKARRVVVEFDVQNMNTVLEFYARGSDSTNGAAHFSGNGDSNDAIAVNNPATGTYAGTFATARRYVHLFLFYNGTTDVTSTGADHTIRIKRALVVSDTAYESGNQSILSPDDVIRDALAAGTVGLSADLTGISAAAFDFPDFTSAAPRTPRELLTAANAPMNWLLKVDERGRLIFRPRPAAPLVELGAWAGGEFTNASPNSSEGVVTKAIVRGQGPDGTRVSVTRTQTGTIVDRQGDRATKTLDTSFKLNTTLANKLGDVYLDAHRLSPFKGQARTTMGGVRRVLGGEPVHPAHLLPLTGELLRLSHLTDPDTGAHSRNGTINQVTYRDDDVAAEIDIDSSRQDFEAMLEGLGLLIPA